MVSQDARRNSFGNAGLLVGMASLRASLPTDRVVAREAVVALDSESEVFEDMHLLVEVISIVASR